MATDELLSTGLQQCEGEGEEEVFDEPMDFPDVSMELGNSPTRNTLYVVTKHHICVL